MIQLNLLPLKVRAAELLRKALIGAGLAYVVATAWVGWQWSLMHLKLVAQRHEVQKIQAQLDSPELQEAVKAVQKFADDMTAVKAKASVVNELRKQQVPLSRLLDAVPDWTMEGQVWFTSIDAHWKGNAHVVSLVGATLSRSFFVKYYDFMGSQPLVKGLSLDGPPTPTSLRNVPAVSFRLGFSVEDLP